VKKALAINNYYVNPRTSAEGSHDARDEAMRWDGSTSLARGQHAL